ncbi:MAG TPA: Dam family site-specific DNA-(adenine-N6)-methyltransferase [Acidimicrobiia bacterium]|nr:Dam family site-specific DNA-(adenine-N6)-methyltransferase [Acidimicrobiia bacterium]
MVKPDFVSNQKIRISPLIKWPGGKREILNKILPFLPAISNRYFEPFLGGGALFFAIQPERSVLSDLNEELINLYVQVRDYPEELISIMSSFENSEKAYYKIRSSKFRTPLKRAARLLYLTTLSFNGIHRVNLSGEFNVPYGRKTHLLACDEEKIRSISQALSSTELKVSDFETATRNATSGDLIYFDPPYTVAHSHNGFLKYNEKIFSWSDQIRLAGHAYELYQRGCHVVVSNADHPSVRKLYRGFKCKVIERFSRIAADSEHRKIITEALFYQRGC